MELDKHHTVWWIDERGRWNNFQNSHNGSYPDFDILGPSSRQNLNFFHYGMIKFIDYGSLIDIHWDVQNVSPGAMKALLEYLFVQSVADQTACYVALKFYFGAWNTELYDTLDTSFQRIVDINTYQGTTPNETITIANMDLADTCNGNFYLHQALIAWQKAEGVLVQDQNTELKDILDRSLIYGIAKPENKFVFKQIGTLALTTSLLGEEWRYGAIDKTTTDNYSDDMYEVIVCADYSDVIESNIPRLDHITAYYKLEGDDPLWVNYERLLLPWKTSDGEIALMCLSIRSQNLSIPFLQSVSASDDFEAELMT